MNHPVASFFSLAVLVWLSSASHAQWPNKVAFAVPQAASVRSDRLAAIDELVQQAIAQGQMPGCVVAVGRHDKLIFLRAYGHRQLKPELEPMTIDTVFDLASLTKPIVTATCAMILCEQGKLKLDDPVVAHLPEFGANGKQSITLFQLLTHQSGLTPDNPLADYRDGKQLALRRIYQLQPSGEPGRKFIYSDVGFIVLGDVVESVSGQPLDEFAEQHLFGPLKMHDTQFNPPQLLRRRAAATESRNQRWMKGEVHDPRAHLIGGVAGHAGLFSTAPDLAVYAQMLLRRGRWGSKRIAAESTIKRMTMAYPVSSGTRGLGWDKQTGYSTNKGMGLSDRAFGHGGFTGTAMWIDPQLDLFYIFLSNRLHPDGRGSVNRLVGRIGSLIVEAMLPETQTTQKSSSIATGLDRLVQSNFAELTGKRIGLITNHTGIDRHGRRNVDLLHDSDQVRLVALFSPEHGVTGAQDAAIGDARDAGTELPIYSLYGERRQPTAEQLDQVDCLVFDVQDIGARFYTYISTMGLAMEAAAEHNKQFIVLDRPNPVGGVEVAGPLPDPFEQSFISYHPLPIQHGMTVGELARMFQVEKKLKLDLHVVTIDGWSREQTFDQTGLLWVNPSPNIRNLNQALLYPGIGLLESTNISVGRGTDQPFELFGAPWMDGQAVARWLNRSELPGVRFVPLRFVPQSSKYAGQSCGGVNILITDRGTFRAVRTGFAVAKVLLQLYPDQWSAAPFGKRLSNRRAFQAFLSGQGFDQIQAAVQSEMNAFLPRRAVHLMYESMGR